MLIDYGSLCLIETFIRFWGWNEDSIYQSIGASKALREFVAEGKVPDDSAWKHRRYQEWIPFHAYSELVSAAERFLLAHELGHLVLGHLSEATLTALPSRAGDVPIVSNSWEHEYEADRFALMVLMPARYDRLKIRQATAAPYIVFVIAQLYEHLMKPERKQQDTHPPATLRLAAIEHEIGSALLTLDSDLGPKCLDWVEGCRILLDKSPDEVERMKRIFGED